MRPGLRSRLREARVEGSGALGRPPGARESPVEKPGRVRTRGASSEPRRGESRSALQDNRGGPGLGAASGRGRAGSSSRSCVGAAASAAPGLCGTASSPWTRGSASVWSVGAARRFLPYPALLPAVLPLYCIEYFKGLSPGWRCSLPVRTRENSVRG